VQAVPLDLPLPVVKLWTVCLSREKGRPSTRSKSQHLIASEVETQTSPKRRKLQAGAAGVFAPAIRAGTRDLADLDAVRPLFDAARTKLGQANALINA